MTKNQMQCILAILLIIFVALSFSGCQIPTAQMQAGNRALPPKKAIRTKPDLNPEIKLNGSDMGTTRNLSLLGNRLKKIFKQREENFTFRENTIEVEKTVFIDPAPSLKVKEVARVIKALEDYGAHPLMLPIEINGTTDWDWAMANANVPPVNNAKPNPLMLFVTIGKYTTEFPADADGISLKLLQTTIPRRESYGLDGLVVDVRNEGEYLIDDKTVAKTALENIFKTFLKNAASEDSKRIIVNLENNADKISFGSVFDIAREAYSAGIKEIELRIYFPTQWRILQIKKWGVESLSLPAELTEESESTENQKNKDITWTDYSRSWEKPSGNEVLPFEVNLSITTWDVDFAKVTGLSPEASKPENLVMLDHLANEKAKTNEAPIEEAGYLELNGIRGSFFRAQYGEDRKRIGWVTYRYFNNKAQRITISVVCAGNELQKSMMIIKSLRFQ